MRAHQPATPMSLVGATAVLVGSLTGCSTTSSPGSSGATAPYEDIFILRSERKERVARSTWCTTERAGFASLRAPALMEERFNFWSVETRAADGRISNAQAANLGEGRACFGMTESRTAVNFYLEGTFGTLSISGRGECDLAVGDMPEKDMFVSRCVVPLKVASDSYTGGLLVTSSLTSKELYGLVTNPPGYTQVSIGTIRLWRRH